MDYIPGELNKTFPLMTNSKDKFEFIYLVPSLECMPKKKFVHKMGQKMNPDIVKLVSTKI